MLFFKVTGVYIEFDFFFVICLSATMSLPPSTFVVLHINRDITFGKFCVFLNF